jgi:hypothetical protein
MCCGNQAAAACVPILGLKMMHKSNETFKPFPPVHAIHPYSQFVTVPWGWFIIDHRIYLFNKFAEFVFL